jgi:hypothetical protein
MCGVRGLSHFDGEISFLGDHDLALRRGMRVLIAMSMAIKLATGRRNGLIGPRGLSIPRTLCFLCRALAALLVFLQVLVLVFQDRIGTLELH